MLQPTSGCCLHKAALLCHPRCLLAKRSLNTQSYFAPGVAWGHPCERCPARLDCQPGYLKNVHTGKCMDIDECEAIPGLCDGGECVNSAGSFKCICPPGTVVTEKQECRDRDECEDGSHTCHRGRWFVFLHPSKATNPCPGV